MAWQVKRTRADGTRTIRVAWRDKTRGGKTQSETFLASQKQTADSFLRDVEAAGNQWPPGWIPGEGYPPPNPSPSGYTVRDACIKAVDVNRRAARGTKADYRREINRYLPETDPLAAMFVEDVTIESVEEWHTRLAEMMTEPGGPKKSKRKTPFVSQPLSAKTRRNAHTRLSAGLALMVRYGHIPMNPATGLGPPRTRNKKIQALTPEEYTALLAYIPKHWKPFVETLARTGMRFSEVTALTARRVALTNKPAVIYVQEAYKRTDQYAVFEKGATKSEQGMRVVPIDAHLKRTLAPLVRGKKPDDEVFTTEWGNTIRHTNFHSRVWRPAVLKARKEHAISFTPTIHDLRHAHATWLLTAGIPVHTTADRLGHDPAVLLREYAHLLDTGRTAAPDTITQLLDGGPNRKRRRTGRAAKAHASQG